jgi:hypothetical protein
VPRCLIFNPYFAVLGGGERYTVAVGDAVSRSHDVVYAAPFPPNQELARTLGFPPVDVMMMSPEAFSAISADFDLAVVITLDVPPRSFATRNIAVVQFPLGPLGDGTNAGRRRARAVLRRYHCIVYSEYVKHWLERRWGVTGTVVMPPCHLAVDEPSPKENLVLAVGRFLARPTDQWNSKRQDVMVSAFSQLPRHLRESWRLVLAGGAAPSPDIDRLLDGLRREADGLPITIETNVPADRLDALQRAARLFWHASGFERPADRPAEAEHFGISTVEAMSYGAIPLVYADGGQPEIVDPAWGRLWHSVPELVDQTVALMEQTPDELDRLGAAARHASARFGPERFDAEVRDLLAGIGALHWSTNLPGRAVRRLNRTRRRALGARHHKRSTQDEQR